MPPDIIVGAPAELADHMAATFSGDGGQALAARGVFSIALAGGSAASVLLPPLSRLPFDWPRTEVFWADERAVPTDDPESNYGLARKLLLDPATIPPGRVHRMQADATSLEQAAQAYADEMTRVLGTPPQLDLALLGVGPDGHVASLFPGHPALREEGRFVAAVPDAPKPPPGRLTLTLPVLTAVRHVVVFATGESKALVLRAALEAPDSRLPIALLARQARRVTFLLDPEAASAL